MTRAFTICVAPSKAWFTVQRWHSVLRASWTLTRTLTGASAKTLALYHSHYCCTIPTIAVPFTLLLYHSHYCCTIHTIAVPFPLLLYHSHYCCTIPTIAVSFTLLLYHSHYFVRPSHKEHTATVVWRCKVTTCVQCAQDRVLSHNVSNLVNSN